MIVSHLCVVQVLLSRDDVLQLSGVQCVAEVLLHHSHYTQALLRADIAGQHVCVYVCVCVSALVRSQLYTKSEFYVFISSVRQQPRESSEHKSLTMLFSLLCRISI